MAKLRLGKQPKKQQRKKGIPKPVLGLLVIALFGGISYAAAWTWHNAQELRGSGEVSVREAPDTAESELPQAPVSQAAVQPDPAPEQSPEEQEEQADPEEGGEGEEQDSTSRPDYPGAVPLSQRVDNSYFDDAIFFGDSISVGIPLYKVMPNVQVVAVQGATPVNAGTKELIATEDGGATLLEAAQGYGEKKKVYIMLGENGLADEADQFIDGYREFVRLVKEQYPGALIYLQSILPVTEDATEKYPYADNQVINERNQLILALAREQGVYYVDVAAALVDEAGNLPKEFSPKDGVHVTAEAYHLWFEYLRTHTVGGTL